MDQVLDEINYKTIKRNVIQADPESDAILALLLLFDDNTAIKITAVSNTKSLWIIKMLPDEIQEIFFAPYD